MSARDEPAPLVARQVGPHPVGGDARGCDQALGQAVGQVGRRGRRTAGRPDRQAAWSLPVELLGARVGDEVEPELERPGPVVAGHGAAHVEDRRAGQAEVGEQDGLAPLLERPARRRRWTDATTSGRVRPLERRRPSRASTRIGTRAGAGLDDRVAEPPGDRVAVAGRPAARVRLAADRHDHPPRA